MALDRSNPRRAAVALVHGWEQQNGECRDCGTSPTVLGTMLCSEHYEAVMASRLRAPKATNAANRLAYDAKRVAWRVWAEGVVALRELAPDDDALSEAVRRRWVAEVDDDARPGDVLPTGLPVSARAAMLMRYLKVVGRPVTHDEAAAALGLTRAQLGPAVTLASSDGRASVKRGSRQTIGLTEPGAPAAPIIARMDPEARVQQLARLAQERPGIRRREAAEAMRCPVDTVSRAASLAVERGLITAGVGPASGYQPVTAPAT